MKRPLETARDRLTDTSTGTLEEKERIAVRFFLFFISFALKVGRLFQAGRRHALEK